jgi:hypothetical protein
VADDQTRRVLAGKGCKPDKLMREAFIPGGQKIRDASQRRQPRSA